MIFFEFIFLILIFNANKFISNLTENNYLPTKCESCVIFARELESITLKLPKQVNFFLIFFF